MSRHPLGGAGLVLATAALWSIAGLPGLAAGLLAIGAWAVAPATLAYAVGQTLAVPLLGSVDVLPLVAIEIGLLGVLAGPLAGVDRQIEALLTFVVATGGFAGIAWLVLGAGEPVWVATVAMALVAATTAYGVHRYERVRLGLVEGGV